MKKLVLLLGLMFALQAAMMAQQNTDNILFTAHLNQTFNINVPSGDAQIITFANAADYNNGVVATIGIMPGISRVTVEATADWNMTIECPNFTGAGIIPIENLGVAITDVGTHHNNAEVVYTALPGTPQPLTIAPAALISKGSLSDAGDISDNSWDLTWEMGTLYLQGLNGPIGSMFDQMAAGYFPTGDYTTTAVVTLIPVSK